MKIEAKKKFITDTAFLVLLFAILYCIIKYLAVWLMPFLIGFVIASLLKKPVTYLCKKTHIPRSLWSVVFVFLCLGVILALIVLFVTRIYSETVGFINWVIGQAPQLQVIFDDIIAQMSRWLDGLPAPIYEAVKDSPATIVNILVGFLTDFASAFTKSALVNIPAVMLTTVLSTVAACFILSGYDKITKFLLCQFSERRQKIILDSGRIFSKNIFKMLTGYVIILFITFLELFIGFSLIGIKYALIISALVAILDIMPVIGTGTVLVPWAIIDFIAGNSTSAIKILSLYVILTVIRNIIEPKIIGKQVGLPPLVTLISMYVGLNILGFAGMFILPLIVIVLVQLQKSGTIHIWKTPPEEI